MTQYKLVPVEPTEEMIRAMEREWITGSSIDMAKREYKAMLATAPQPAQEPVAWRVQVDGLWFHARDREGLIQALGVKLGISEHGLTPEPLYATPTQTAPTPADSERKPFGDLRNAKWLDPECYSAGACQSLKFKAAPAVAELVEALDRAIKALKFYADGDFSVMLTGFKNGKRINWKEEQKSLEERGFSRVCELYDGSEEWAENGQVAQTAIDSIEAALISYQEQKQ